MCLTASFLATVVSSNYFTKFHDFSMIIQVFSNSMIFPCMALFLVIFQVFHHFQNLWEPCLLEWFSRREKNNRRNNFMINLHESMGPGRNRTSDSWICSRTCICSQTHYQLSYEAWYLTLCNLMDFPKQIKVIKWMGLSIIINKGPQVVISE